MEKFGKKKNSEKSQKNPKKNWVKNPRKIHEKISVKNMWKHQRKKTNVKIIWEMNNIDDF